MNIREISDVFKDTANQITAIKSYNFGWASDRTRSTNTEDYQELNEFPRVFFSVPTITGSDQTRKQDTYQVTIFFDDLLGYNNEGDADLTLQIDKWAALQEYANYFIQRLNKVKQSILPNYLFIPEAPSITFDSFTGLQRMITVQLSFTLVVPTNCEPIVSTLIECIANIITSSNLTASITRIIKLVSTLQASSLLSATALVSKLAQSNLNTESSLAANIQLAKLPSSSLNAGGTLVGDAFITRLFAASLNGNGSIFANPLITKFAASSLNGGASLNASALVSKLPASSLTGAGTLAAELTAGGAFDPAAQAFFDRVTTAGGTLSATEKTAVNTLVIGMKADGIWTKMKAIYPMVGASAAACAQNLVSASFTGLFGSGGIFTSNGFNPSTSSFMDTQLIPINDLQLNSVHVSQYYKLYNIIVAPGFGSDNGSFANAIHAFWNYTDIGLIARINTSGGYISGGFAFTKGLAIASRTASNLTKYYNRNNSPFSNGNISFGLSNFPIYLCALNQNGVKGGTNSNILSFTSIGDGITDTDALNLNTRVESFQTTLSRQAI